MANLLIAILVMNKLPTSHFLTMQDYKNNLQNRSILSNYDDSHLNQKIAPSRRRFIECLRCGKLIKNNLRVIKNHEYYCSHKKLAVNNNEINEADVEPLANQDSESEVEPNIYKESEQNIKESANVTSILKIISSLIIVGVFLIAILRIVNALKINAKIKQAQQQIGQNKQTASSQASQQLAPPMPYSMPRYRIQ